MKFEFTWKEIISFASRNMPIPSGQYDVTHIESDDGPVFVYTPQARPEDSDAQP